MEPNRNAANAEHGSSTLELVGITAAVVALTVALATALHPRGGELAGGVAQQITSSILQPQQPATASVPPFATLLTGRARTWRERRAAGGDVPLHVPRDDLRMSPLLAPAIWQRSAKARWTAGGFHVAGDVRSCALCATLEWSRSLQSGATMDGNGHRSGLEGELALGVEAALASTSVGGRVERGIGPALAHLQGRLRATLGGTAEGRALLVLERDAQELELRGGAMAGAVGRADGTFGVRMLGISIEQSGRAEGWAGAGARGVASLRRDAGRVEWTFGWGIALGLGGAAEWSGAVDVSEVPAQHRRLARDALGTAARLASSTSPFPLVRYHLRRGS